jgi:hypothetical protein
MAAATWSAAAISLLSLLQRGGEQYLQKVQAGRKKGQLAQSFDCAHPCQQRVGVLGSEATVCVINPPSSFSVVKSACKA